MPDMMPSRAASSRPPSAEKASVGKKSGNLAGAGTANPPTPAAALAQQRAAGNQSVVAATDRRYDLTVGGEAQKGLTVSQALDVLGRHYRRVHSSIEGVFEGHVYLMQLQRDQPFAAYVSETLGGVDMPELEIWDRARDQTWAAQKALKARSVDEAIQRIQSAIDAYDRAYRVFLRYRDGTETGADRAITGLRFTAAAGAVAATVATGGLAGGGLLASSAVAAGTAGAYGATQEFAGQGGEMIAGTRKSFDAAAILKRGASDAIVGFVGSIAGGALAKQFSKMFGSYLSKAKISDEALLELGEALGFKGALPRDFFLTGGQRFIRDFLSGAGTSPLTAAVGVVVNRFTGAGKMPSMDEFLHTVLEEMVKGGVTQALLGSVLHGRSLSDNVLGGKGSKKGGSSRTGRESGSGEKAASREPAAQKSESGEQSGVPESLRQGKAANDNVESPGPEPGGASQAIPEQLLETKAANDNVEMSVAQESTGAGEMKMAAGAEGMSRSNVQATRGGGGSKPPGGARPRAGKSASAGPAKTTAAGPKRSGPGSRKLKAAEKLGNQELDPAARAEADAAKSKVESKITEGREELSANSDMANRGDRTARGLASERPPMPPELEGTMRKIDRQSRNGDGVIDFESKASALSELLQQPDLTPESRAYLEWARQAAEARGDQQAGRAANQQLVETQKTRQHADLPDAIAALRDASRSSKGWMRVEGPNYAAKKNLGIDEVLNRPGAEPGRWEALVADNGGRKPALSPDHLVSLDEIANTKEFSKLVDAYRNAKSPETRTAILESLISLGDRPTNLVNMQKSANESKGARDWAEMEAGRFSKYKYDLADIEYLRERQATERTSILQAIEALAKSFGGQ